MTRPRCTATTTAIAPDSISRWCAIFQRKSHHLERLYSPRASDVVLDIGSNDATSLKSYKTAGLQRIGIDPTGAKFRQFYGDDIALVPDFFSAAADRSSAQSLRRS